MTERVCLISFALQMKLYKDMTVQGVVKLNEWDMLTEKLIDYEEMKWDSLLSKAA